MKIEVYLLRSDMSRDLVLDETDYRTKVRGGVSVLMKEIADYVVGKVVVNYFKNGFSLNASRISANAGVLRQRLSCGGRNVVLKSVDGRMVPYEDQTFPDREFEIVVRLDSDSLYLKPLSGIHLKRLEIENLRSIRQRVITFNNSSNILLLAGLNGSGKTSVLEAILYAFLKNERKSGVRPLADQDFRIILEFSANGGGNYKIERTRKFHKLIDGEGNVLADTDFEFRRLFSDMDLLFVPSWRCPITPRKGHLTLRYLSRPPDDDPIESLRFSCLSEFINKKLNPTAPTLDYLMRLNACWKRFYPEQDGGFVVEEDVAARQMASPGELMLDVFLRRTKAGTAIKLSELSSGELEILSLVAQVMVAKSKYDFVLIDEPELHLNRVWHATLIDVITHLDDGCQFVMATHSPEIWDAVYSWNRIFLDDEEFNHG